MSDFMDYVEVASAAQRGDVVVVVLTAVVPKFLSAGFINDLAEQFIADLMTSAGVEYDEFVVGGNNGTRS